MFLSVHHAAKATAFNKDTYQTAIWGKMHVAVQVE